MHKTSTVRFIGLALIAAALPAFLFNTGNSNAAGNSEPAGKTVKLDVLEGKPLWQTLQSLKLQPVKRGKLRVPTITWPGDVSTVYSKQEGLFQSEGLDVELFCENDFAKQVQGVINGETPILRGTMGMINSAAETFKKAGTELVVVYQLTWSTGGDCLVVRSGINNLSDLKGKTIALQLYGPHMDYLTTVLSRGGLKPSQVNLKWFKELTVPSYDTNGRAVDPGSAFAASSSIDACFVISPDIARLTGGGDASGAEGVKGAKVLFTSRSANRIICDVYAIRKDWYDANKDKVEHFVHTLMLGQEKFESVLADKSSNATKYKELLKVSTNLLYGADDAALIKSNEESLGDCEWVGFAGNVSLFTGKGTTRNFAVLTNEIQSAFIDLGLMNGRVDLDKADWDYTRLAQGLAHANLNVVPKQAFDTARVQQKMEEEMATELDSWQEGALVSFEIYFAPNKEDFTSATYHDAFQKAIEAAQTFGGTVVIIEGHNSPDAVNKAKREGKSPTEVAQLESWAKNRSLKRARAVRDAFLNYCKDKGLEVDESQFAVTGLGVKSPKYAKPQTKAEWNENRRVVFRIKTVETELDEFTPPSN